jgi:general secretion pathway protein C
MLNAPTIRIKRFHIENTVKLIRIVGVCLTTIMFAYALVVIFYREFVILQGDRLALQAYDSSIVTNNVTTNANISPNDNHSSRETTLIPPKAATSYIAKSDLFGQLVSPNPVPKQPPTQNNISPSNTLNLVGTFLSHTRDSYAIIQNKTKGEQDVFLVSDSVFDNGTLVKIESNSVIIERDGKREQLLLEDGDGSKGGGAETDSTAEIVPVSEADVQDALNNLPLLLTQARTVPYFSNGQRDGRRIFAIRSGSFFEKIGLVNGDIIKSINSKDLNDDGKALELFEEFKSARTLSVRLVRNREEKVITYERR